MPKLKPIDEAPPPRKTLGQLKKENELLQAKLDKIQQGAYCYMCDTFKPKSDFYSNYDPNVRSGITCICKLCAGKLAKPPDPNGNPQPPTKQTAAIALEYLDKPLYDSLWDSSFAETLGNESKSSGYRKDPFGTYMKNIALAQNRTKRWHDSDVFREGTVDAIQRINAQEGYIDDKIREDYVKNKKDVITQVGYDPFENYRLESDKPFLYASLNSFIDEETKNDGMKLKAVIQIVKTYNQIEKINDAIDSYVTNANELLLNIPGLDKLTATVDKLIRSSAKLAQDNGISVNFNNNKSKGANTLSGKIKHLHEIGFQDARINGFDIGTSQGMQIVAELSEKARHEQIGYDENIAQEIKDIKVQLVEDLTKERDAAVESLRKLIEENIALKKYMESKGLIDASGQVIDDGH